MTLLTNPITGPFIIIAAASFTWAVVYGSILERRKRQEAEARAQAKAQQEAEAARKRKEAATRKAREASDKRAAKSLCKIRETESKAAQAAAAREAKRKLTAAELLKDAPEGAKPFAGQRIAFSGRFPRVERSQLIQVVSALGGRGHDTTHAGTTLLVLCPHSGNGQIEKAQHWKIPTITWEQWYKQAFGKEPGPEFTAAI